MIKSLGGKTPRVAESAFVSEAAYVVGDVTIGENSSVWPGAVVRGDFAPIIIGNYVHIEDNCVLHCGEALHIGDNVTIGHGVVVHCRRIGSNVLIGSGTILLDEAEVGDCCMVSAGSLVGQGARIPDMSFVAGAPAKVRGTVSEDQLARLQNGPRLYAAKAREHKMEGL